ncbi:MAG: helix-turn-helix domain-containing protein [Myxococcota bacterium]
MADMPIGLYRLDVSKGAKLVLSYLWRYAGRERFVWVDRETIAGDLGIESERTLRRHLGELRKAGVIAEDVQVRMGKARPGWWLRDRGDVGRREGVGRDVGGGSGVEAHEEVEEITAGGESEGVVPAGVGREPGASGAEVSKVHRESGQNWPAPDKDGWERPRLAEIPDKSDLERR